MTSHALKLSEALLGDLRKNPEIQPSQVIQAIILATRQFRYDLSDFKELMRIFMAEFGWPQKDWEDLAIKLISEVPEVGDGQAKDMGRLLE